MTRDRYVSNKNKFRGLLVFEGLESYCLSVDT